MTIVTDVQNTDLFAANLPRRKQIGRVFAAVCLGAITVGMLFLAILLLDVFVDGLRWFSPQLVTAFPSRFPEQAGMRSALQGTLWLITMTIVIALPIGVGAAIYLEEYAPKNRFAQFIEINVANLAGVPSIIYGLLGLGLFVRYLALGRSVLAGSLTMALLILPIIIVSSREAIRAVPQSMRLAAYALGATQWQTIRAHVLPSAAGGILTGNILAMSRAIGETAPLITIGALTFISFDLQGPLDIFTVLPIQIFNWISLPQQEFHELAAAGIIILLLILLSMNALTIFLRYRLQRKW
jgi:phosphate transport system permease protein